MSRQGATPAKPCRAPAATASRSFHCRLTVARLSDSSAVGIKGPVNYSLAHVLGGEPVTTSPEHALAAEFFLHRLRGHAHRRIDGAETVVAPPLDELEEEAVIEGARKIGRASCRERV